MNDRPPTPIERAVFYATRHASLDVTDPAGPGLLTLATVWAAIAQAGATERVADQLTRMNERAERTETDDL